MKIAFLILALMSTKVFAGGCGEHAVAKCSKFIVIESICPTPETPSGPAGINEIFSMAEQVGGPKVDFTPLRTNANPEIYKLQLDFFTDLNIEIDNTDRTKLAYSSYTVRSGVNGPVEKCENLDAH